MQNSWSLEHSDQAIGFFIPSLHICLDFQVRERGGWSKTNAEI